MSRKIWKSCHNDDIGTAREIYYITDDYCNDSPYDAANPIEIIAGATGANRRTITTGAPIVENGPPIKRGVRQGFYVMRNDLGDVALVQVESAGELAQLPQDALPAQEYLNLLEQEDPVIANELRQLLTNPEHHTSHHTAGANIGDRVKSLFQKAKLNHIPQQDPQLGQGIEVVEVRHCPSNTTILTGYDQVVW